MNSSFEELQRKYIVNVDEWSRHNVLTRSVTLQSSIVRDSESLLLEIKRVKYDAQTIEDCGTANRCFHMQCMVNSLRSSLKMWISLKSEDFPDAWTLLIDSQEYVGIARQIEDYEGARRLAERLIEIEYSVFPSWALYNSAGFTETVGSCSVCGQSFLDCEHIEDHVYCGKYCRRLNRKVIDINHSALVSSPRDKRCIITALSREDGRMIDYFTHEETGRTSNGKGIGEFEGRVFSFQTLDLE